MADYGSATITRKDDGSYTVERADDVIGIAVEVLADADPAALRVTSEGHLSMGSDGLTLYRPVRFDPASGTRVLVCEQVSAAPEVPIRETTVIQPGDHLIVRVEGNLTMQQADLMKQRIKERLPLLSDVTVVQAAGLAVFREQEADHG